SLASSLDVCPYFLLGACAQFYQFKALLHPGVALGMIGLAAFIQPSGAMLTELTLYILTTVAVLGFALTPAPVLSRAGRWGDFSYGIYLYGFAVQQSVNALAGSPLTPLQNAMMSIPIAVVLAVFSWRLVERRALALKPKRAAPRTVPAVEVQA